MGIHPSFRPSKDSVVKIYMYAFGLEFGFLLGRLQQEDLKITYILSKELEKFFIVARKEESDQDDIVYEDCFVDTRSIDPTKYLACDENSNNEDLGEEGQRLLQPKGDFSESMEVKISTVSVFIL
jgi:hypothetical protein